MMSKPRILIAVTCLAVAGFCWMRVGAQDRIHNEPKDYSTTSDPQTYDTPARRAALRRQMNARPVNLRVGQLIGMSLKDKSGTPLGTVRDLVIDARTGGVKYALVRLQDPSDVNSRDMVTPIPWSVIESNIAVPHGPYLSFKLAPGVLEKAPSYGINDVDVNHPEFGLTAARYFHDPDLGTPQGAQIKRRYEPAGGVPFQ
jgi:sporulation protein YlmC with PRC-barrel domain